MLIDRRTLLGGLVGVGAAATLAACGSNNSSGGGGGGGGTTTLAFYGGWTGSDLAKMQALVDKFNSSQSEIKVQFTSQQWTNMFTKFLADVQAGSSPDVVAMHTFEVGQFAAMGILDDEPVSSLGLQQDDFLPIAWDGAAYQGKQMGVPIDVNMHAIYYNKSLLSKAGVTSLPSDRDSMIEACLKTTVDKNGKHPDASGFDSGNVSQYGLGFLMNHHTFYQAWALMNQQGYAPFTADMTSVTLDVPKMTNVIDYLQSLVFKNKVVPNGEKSPIDDFKAGKIAMCIDGNWQLSGFTDVGFEWDTMPYTKVFDQSAVWGASEMLTFPKASKNKEAAQKFVKWISENSADWAASGQIPANKSAKEKATKLPGISAYEAELDYVKFLPAHPKATKLFSSTAPSPILTFAQDTVLNDKPAADIVKTFQDNLNSVLSQA